MNWMHSCRRAAQLLSQRLDEPLGAIDELKLRLHLSLCGNCRNVEKQLSGVHAAAADLFSGGTDLDEERGHNSGHLNLCREPPHADLAQPRPAGERVNAGPAEPAFSPVGIVLAVGVALLLVVGVGTWWLWPMELGIGGENTIEGMVAQIRSWGPWAALGSIVLMVVHSFLPFPSELITLANGMVFGPFWGSAITWVGAMLGAISTFGLVRLLSRPFVHRMLSENQLRRLSQWSSTQGGMALLIGRLIPVIAFNLLNYGAALTEISWWTFIWATGIGILPLTILLNVFGAGILAMKAWNWMGLLLGVVVVAGWVLARRRSRADRGASSDG